MEEPDKSLVAPEISPAWHSLRQWTAARVAQGRVGGSLPVREVLDFRLAHAKARDAVHQVFQAEKVASEIREIPAASMLLSTCVDNRFEYLQRPDRGRSLSDESKKKLESEFGGSGGFDLVIIVSDGLSATATHLQSQPLLQELLPLLSGWKLAPVMVVPFARVAVQDEIGAALSARMALILLGERPGLGSPDSLGAYLVWDPKPGNSDAGRNCISNIRKGGLGHQQAARQLFDLLTRARGLGYSGVNLKAADLGEVQNLKSK